MKLADGLLNSARREPGKTAMVFNGREYSYSQVKDGVYAVASALNQTSLKPGDNVGLWSGNCPEYVEVLLGASLVGAVPELYNARWSESVICDLIEQGNVRILFVGPNLPISAIVSKFPHIQIIVIGDEVPNGAQGYGPFVASVPQSHFSPYEFGPCDTALHMFTSGTTSTPKCVLTSCGAVAMQTLISSLSERWSSSEVCLCCFPFFHVSGFSIYKVFLNGGTLVISKTAHADEIAQLIERYHVTRAALVPILMKELLNHKEKTGVDLSSLRLISYGSTHVDSELLARCAEVIGCGFYQAYGMTESAGPVTALTPEDHADASLLETAGKPIFGADVKIVSEDGFECPVGTTGEIVLRAYTTMRGYRDRDALTKEVLVDGWYHTRDCGYIDQRGYLHVEGRKDGMIISGGENIFPQELADCIGRMNGVVEADVIGVDDRKWGQCPIAFVVKNPESDIDERDVIGQCVSRLGRFKKPRKVYFLDGLPRGGTGKVSESELRNIHLAAQR